MRVFLGLSAAAMATVHNVHVEVVVVAVVLVEVVVGVMCIE